MKANKDFIALGGCHVDGYGASDEPSFIDIVQKDVNSKCILKKSLYKLKNAEKIEAILKEYPTHLVVLQLGNYEFHPSLDFKNYLNKKNKLKNQSFETITPPSVINHDFYDGRGLLYRNLIYFIKVLLSPIYWYLIEHNNKKYLIQLRKIIKGNYDKDFVIITPLPFYHSANNIIRKRAISLYENYFSNLPNVIFVNSFEDFPFDKDMFYNPAHLSAKGHKFLGDKTADAIIEYYKK